MSNTKNPTACCCCESTMALLGMTVQGEMMCSACMRELMAENTEEDIVLPDWDLEPADWSEDGDMEIEVQMDSAVGPRVIYRDATEEQIEAALPAGWTVDWSNQVKFLDGRRSSPVVEAEDEATTTWRCTDDGSDGADELERD